MAEDQSPEVRDQSAWQLAGDKAISCVVSINFNHPYNFETETSTTGQVTGFVVDAERGLILTNRHVAGAGPFTGSCTFQSLESVDVVAVWCDPIHDFAFLRFDPKKIKHMSLSAMELKPHLAKVGTEIRMIGNDAGERLSILSGVLSRMDRNSPQYQGYRDFNMVYYQASASGRGGSSGSPVINMDGHAIAMAAGGRANASTNFFIPLDRPMRALRCIQDGRPVTRGDIQCRFLIRSLDECKQLGLSNVWETNVRASGESNMLVAAAILRCSPSDGRIKVGDIVVRINDKPVTQLMDLADILDTAVGSNINLLLQRGGVDVEVEVMVGDLHAMTPNRFLSVAGGIFHDLAPVQAQRFAVPCRGVYLCKAAGTFQPDDTVSGANPGILIIAINHEETPDLASLIEIVKKIPDRSRTIVRYKYLRNPNRVYTMVNHFDRHWYPDMEMAVRNNDTGLWDFQDLGPALPPNPTVPRTASFITVEHETEAMAALARSFVQVNCTIAVAADGTLKTKNSGFGLVLDAERGLVVTSRANVPHCLCDIYITIAGSIVVEGTIQFLHPIHNYAIVGYDPSLVRAPVHGARLATERLTVGDDTYFMGYDSVAQQVRHAETTVTEIETETTPACSKMPRYRLVNMDAIGIDNLLGEECDGGVLAAADGKVQALWLKCWEVEKEKDVGFQVGLPTSAMIPIVSALKEGTAPQPCLLPAELEAVDMAYANVHGVSDAWIQAVAKANPTHHQLFQVTKPFPNHGDDSGGPTTKLVEGDILLSLNGRIITRISDMDVVYQHEEMDATVVRGNKELTLRLKTRSAFLETQRVVFFAGAILQAPHIPVLQQISDLPSEVYVSSVQNGSPAKKHGLFSPLFITHINDEPTQNLESFIKMAANIPGGTYFKLQCVTLDDRTVVIAIKGDEHYFPTVQWIKNQDSTWSRSRRLHAPTPSGDCPHLR